MRGRIPGEGHFWDAHARLNPMSERDTRGKANGGDSGDDPSLNHRCCQSAERAFALGFAAVVQMFAQS